MLAEDQTSYTSPFDAIRRVDADGIEYWSARELGVVIPDTLAIPKEQGTVGQIRRTFKHLNTILQYRVPLYVIDLYFPDQMIAVECDEEGHRRYARDADHFASVSDMVGIGSGARRNITDVHISRYGCYLVVRAPVTGHQSQRDQRSRLLWERRLLSA